MTKILFVCLGNICRSTMAEYVMKHLVKQAGLEREFFVGVLRERGVKNEKKVLVLTADGEGKLYLQEKGKKFCTFRVEYPQGKTW